MRGWWERTGVSVLVRRAWAPLEAKSRDSETERKRVVDAQRSITVDIDGPNVSTRRVVRYGNVYNTQLSVCE